MLLIALIFFRSANTDDIQKQLRLQAQLDHLQKAKMAREHYRTTIKKAKDGLVHHLSFDYAQQVTTRIEQIDELLT